MTDEEHSTAIRDAAKKLADLMNAAAETGLLIKVEMRPHCSESQGEILLKRGGYIPIISITRTFHL